MNTPMPQHTSEAQLAALHEDPPVLLPSSPLDRIADLLQRGITPEQLDKFLEVQHKYEAEQARRAYTRAMAAFKAEPIEPIRKLKTVRIRLKPKDGQPEGREMTYRQETLGQVVRAAIPALARHGLTHSWEPSQETGTGRIIGVSCVMTHEAGHSERVTLYGLPDDSGQKNPLQQVRSTITYLQRATLLLITGLAAEDGSDDDARGSHPSTAPEPDGDGKATAAQKERIRKLAGTEERLAKVLAEVGAKSLDELPFESVTAVFKALKQ